MNIILFFIVGSIAGLLGAVFHEANGFQILENFGIGFVGALLGGYMFKAPRIETFGFWGTVGMSAFVAGIFVFAFGFFSRQTRNPPIEARKQT